MHFIKQFKAVISGESKEIVIDGLNRDHEAPMSIKHEGEKGKGFLLTQNFPNTFTRQQMSTIKRSMRKEIKR